MDLGVTMDDKKGGDDAAPASELGATEALAGGGAGTQARAVKCPNCGRDVETGFRFCDGCGTKLDAAPVVPDAEAGDAPPVEESAPDPREAETSAPPAAPVAPERTSRLKRWSRLMVEPPTEKASEVQTQAPAVEKAPEVQTQAPEAAPAEQERAPLLNRWRRRRAERSALGKAERVLAESAPPSEAAPVDTPPQVETPAEIAAPDAADRPPGATSRPKTAEELRGARPAIGGRLQWAEAGDETETSEAEPKPAVWRPVPMPDAEAGAPAGLSWGRFALQFVAALLAGGIALFALAAVASIASDGRVALLEVRGLPIFIGGAVSIIVFVLLRTGERNRPQATRRATIIGVVTGLVGLVVLAGILYQPAVVGKLQPRIERALQVFGSQDADAVEAFEERIVEWNGSAQAYHDSLEVALRNRENVNNLRGSAAEAETTLEGITSEMRASADAAQHPELRDALGDLASIYDDQLGGLRLVNRGLLVDNIELVRTGDARFKEAHERAKTVYESRLRSILQRAGLDVDSFGRAIAG
jgi:hypothetical protein